MLDRWKDCLITLNMDKLVNLFNMDFGSIMWLVTAINCMCLNLVVSAVALTISKAITGCCLHRFMVFRYLLYMLVVSAFLLSIERQTYLHYTLFPEISMATGLKVVALYFVRYFLFQSYITQTQKTDRCAVKAEEPNVMSPPPQPLLLVNRNRSHGSTFSRLFSDDSLEELIGHRRSPLDMSLDLNKYLGNMRTAPSTSSRPRGSRSSSNMFCCPDENAPNPEDGWNVQFEYLKNRNFFTLAFKCIGEYLVYLAKCFEVMFALSDEDAQNVEPVATPACDVLCERYGAVFGCAKFLIFFDAVRYAALNYYLIKYETTITLKPIDLDNFWVYLYNWYEFGQKLIRKCLIGFCTNKRVPVDVALALSLKGVDSYRRSRNGGGSQLPEKSVSVRNNRK